MNVFLFESNDFTENVEVTFLFTYDIEMNYEIKSENFTVDLSEEYKSILNNIFMNIECNYIVEFNVCLFLTK